MAEPSPDRATLRELTIRFTDAFNRDDLAGVMAMMAEDAVYEEFTGRVNRGSAAIRAAFEPQFRGDFGKIRFSGILAWLLWLFVHLMNLVGFRNRVLVLLQWGWNYFSYDRSARLITGPMPDVTAFPPEKNLS